MRIRFAEAALSDLAGIRDHIDRDSPRTAARVIDRIGASIGLMGDFPGLGHPGSVDGTREHTVPGMPYVVVYEVTEGQGILVLRVYHTARDRH